jgi:hypothetical protein
MSLLGQLEADRSLEDPRRLRQRIEALDDLDAYLQDGQSIGTALHQRTKTVYAELEAVNFRFYEAIRRDIQRGAGGNWLLEWMLDWNGATNVVNCRVMTIWTN